MSRRIALQFGRLALSAVLLGYLSLYVDWNEFTSMFANADWSWAVWVLLALIADRLLAAFKWNVLLRAIAVRISTLKVALIYLIAQFWGFFLPSSLSIDIMSGYYLYRATARAPAAASSLLMDRVMGLLTLLLFGVVAALLFRDFAGGETIAFPLLGVLLILFAGLYLVQRHDVMNWVRRRLERFTDYKLVRLFLDIYQTFLTFKHVPGSLLRSFALSCLLQCVRALEIYALARFLNVDLPLLYIFILIAVMNILIALPVSLGGLGVREGTFVSLFGLIGLSATSGFAVSIGLSMLDILLVLLGGAAYLLYQPSADAAPAAASAESRLSKR